MTPPDSEPYRAKKGRRSDAESANFHSDEQLHRNRAPTLGYHRQHLDLWAHSLIQVAVALSRHRAREPERTAA